MSDRPVLWSVAGNDSGGGAGLSADARAAEGCAVHLCPVVASITAQNSLGVARVVPVAADVLDAQLAALAADMRPSVIKTGLIGSAEGVAVLRRWLDRLDADGGSRVRLVVDPVLGASAGGAAFCDDALLAAYRERLLPRADLITPNRREAARLLGVADAATLAEVPAQAAALRALGAGAVAITGGDSADGADALDWIDTPLARGWLALPRLDARHTHGTGCTFATSAAAAMARGFVTADALVLAKMATTAAIAAGHAAGQGAGPVGFDAALRVRLPLRSLHSRREAALRLLRDAAPGGRPSGGPRGPAVQPGGGDAGGAGAVVGAGGAANRRPAGRGPGGPGGARRPDRRRPRPLGGRIAAAGAVMLRNGLHGPERTRTSDLALIRGVL